MTADGKQNGIETLNNIPENGRKKKALPTKTFKDRESLLTVLVENPHIKVVKHMFIASLIGLFVNTVAHDYFKNGELKVGLGVISRGFAKLHLVVPAWCLLNICSILCYYCFNLWANIRINMSPKATYRQFWDLFWLFSVPIYYILHFRAVTVFVGYFHVPIASATVICVEQTRLLMKTHAFIRSNIEKVTSFKPHSDKELKLPGLTHYLYFLFAPTIVYNDTYPRRKSIRWNLIVQWLMEIIGVLFYYAFLLDRFIIPGHQDVGLKPYSMSELVLLMLDHGTVGLLFLLLGFYVVLHTVQNLIGELMLFADREFYRDWWTSTNYSDYFRTWNILVSDWLYTYVYKDCYELLLPGHKVVPKMLVFLLSAIVHEWILTCIFGFFLPALFLVFLFTGSCLTFLKTPNHSILNILIWYCLALGSGWMVSIYSMEYFVRVNVPAENSTIKDFIVPRLFTDISPKMYGTGNAQKKNLFNPGCDDTHDNDTSDEREHLFY